MSAQANTAEKSTELKPNGRDVETLAPIRHSYDNLNEVVLAECTTCTTATSRRLLVRDYDTEDDFKQSIAEGDDDYMPCVIWRQCEECNREESHFVC